MAAKLTALPYVDGELELETVRVGTSAFNCSENVFAILAALAVSTTVTALPTGEAVAVKLALEAFAGTVTLAGNVTDELLLERLTAIALVVAALSVTVQPPVPAPVTDVLTQDRPVNVGVGALLAV